MTTLNSATTKDCTRWESAPSARGNAAPVLRVPFAQVQTREASQTKSMTQGAPLLAAFARGGFMDHIAESRKAHLQKMTRKNIHTLSSNIGTIESVRSYRKG
jgi:hypothetical protein